MRLVQRDPQTLDPSRTGPDIASCNRLHEAVEHCPRQEFGGCVGPLEGRLVVQIAITQPCEHGVQGLGRAPDVDDDAVRVEIGPAKLDIHHVGSAVQALSGAEDIAVQAVGDHHVSADRHAVHVNTLRDDTARRRDQRRDRP